MPSSTAHEVQPQCIATTKSGDRCRNKARTGSRYCAVHAKLEETAGARMPVEEVAEHLNNIADAVAKEDPGFEPPPFSADALLAMMQQNAAMLAKYLPSQTVRDIIDNLEGTTTKDLLDPETWQGLWYILNYSMQGQAKDVMTQIAEKLSVIPGADMMMQFGQSVMESPGELLNVETWKGMFVVLNAAVEANVEAVKGKLKGKE